ncbi:MAG: hypothetical protein N2560_07375, partial [Ignavibacteria bacterium]|nr:hypothetical protein [Ignavibacteria bacterium]
QIQISESSSFSSYVEQQDGIPGNVTSYRVLTSLTDKKTYYWRIRAYRCNPRQYGNWSTVCSFKINLPLTAPTNLRVSFIDTNQRKVTLVWDAVSGSGITYKVFRKKSNETNFREIATGISSNEYTDFGLEFGVTYYYVVIAVKEGKQSEQSNQVEVKLVRNNQDPNPPPQKCYYYPNIKKPILKFCGEYTGIAENKIEFKNKLIINEILVLEGNTIIDTTKFELKFNGEIYIENVKLPGKVEVGKLVIYEGEYFCSFEDTNLITNKDIQKFKKADYFAGIKLIPTKLVFSGGIASTKITMAAEIWLEHTKNCNDRRRRTRFEIQNLEIYKNSSTGNFEVAFKGGLNGLGFGLDQLDGSKIDVCLNQLLVEFRSDQNKIDFDGTFNFDLLSNSAELTFGVTFIEGCFNRGKLGVAIDKPIPLGNLPLGISGFGGEVDGLCEGNKKLSFWGATKPIAYPNLFELGLEATLNYDTKVFLNSNVEIKANAKIWKQKSSEDWIGNGMLRGAWYFNKNTLELNGNLNFIEYKDENDNEDYVIKGNGDMLIYTEKSNDINFNGEIKGSITIPKLRKNEGLFCIECPLIDLYNQEIGGRAIFANANFNKEKIAAVLDFSKLSPSIGKLDFYFDFAKQQLQLGPLLVKLRNQIGPKNSSELILNLVKKDTILIDGNIEKVIWEITVKDSIPNSYITSPLNKSFLSTDSVANVFYLTRKDNKRVWWIVNNPIQGNWILTIQNFSIVDSFNIYVQKKKTVPNFNINLINDKITILWNEVDDGTIKFFADDDSIGYNGFYLGSILSSGKSFTYIIPDTFKMCSFYLYYMYYDKNGNYIQKGYLTPKFNNPKPILNSPNYVKAIYHPHLNSTIIKWNCSPNHLIEGFLITSVEINGKENVLGVVNKGVFEFSINDNLSNKVIKIYSFDINLNKSCPFETLVLTNEIVFENCDKTSKPVQFKYINVPASSRGTVVRIDVETGEVIGEYYTYPNGQGDPSRTTVDAWGNLWVGNRTTNAGLTKIALVVGGTRCDSLGRPNPNGQYLKPPFDWVSVGDWRNLDRNRDGLIKTSKGLQNILRWENLNLPPEDELIVFCKIFNSEDLNNIRHISVDLDNNIWVGGFSFPISQGYTIINNSNGDILMPITKYKAGGYGGFVNSSGFLVSSGHQNGILILNTKKPSFYFVDPNVKIYGCSPALEENMFWATHLESNKILKYKIDTVNKKCTQILEREILPQYGRGICVSRKDGNVWIASSIGSGKHVIRFNPNNNKVDTILLSSETTEPTGVAIDYNENVWVTNRQTHNVMRINPKTNKVELTIDLGPGAGPYTYSDMTGYVLSNFTLPILLTDDTLDFGTITCDNINLVKNLEICNSGYRDLIIFSIDKQKKLKHFTLVIDSSTFPIIVPPGKKVKIKIRIDTLISGNFEETLIIKSNGMNIIDSIKKVVVKGRILLPNYIANVKDTTIINCLTLENMKTKEIYLIIRDINNSSIRSKAFTRLISNGAIHLDSDTINFDNNSSRLRVNILPGFEDLYEEIIFKKDCYSYDTIKIRVKYNSSYYFRTLTRRPSQQTYKEDTIQFKITSPDLPSVYELKLPAVDTSGKTVLKTRIKTYYLLDTLLYCSGFDLIFPEKPKVESFDTKPKLLFILKLDSVVCKNSKTGFLYKDTLLKLREPFILDTIFLISAYYTIENILNVEFTLSESINLTTSPQPADKFLLVGIPFLDSPTDITIKVYNFIGEEVYQFNGHLHSNLLSISTEMYPEGIYLLFIKMKDNIFKTKFFVSH